jgi:hypothetical protein
MRHETDDRPAMNGRKVTIEHCEPMACQKGLDRRQVVVQKMLVIDLIEGQVLDDLLHVEKLHDKHAVALQAFSNAFRYRMQLLEMKKDTRSIDEIELPVQRTRDAVVEEGLERFDSIFVCDGGSRRRRLDTQHRISERLVMLELRSIVRTDVEHGLVGPPLHVVLVDVGGNLGEVVAQRSGDARKVRVITE